MPARASLAALAALALVGCEPSAETYEGDCATPSWEPIDLGVTEETVIVFSDVVRDDDVLYAVGQTEALGYLAERQDGAWSLLQEPPMAPRLRGLAAVDGTLLGIDERSVYRRDGLLWFQLATLGSAGAELHDIAALSSTEIYVAGTAGSGDGFVRRLSGGELIAEDVGEVDGLTRLERVGPRGLWAAGGASVVSTRDPGDARWLPQSLGVGDADVAAMAPVGDEVWVAGRFLAAGLDEWVPGVVRLLHEQPTLHASDPIGFAALALWGESPDDVVAVGYTSDAPGVYEARSVRVVGEQPFVLSVPDVGALTALAGTAPSDLVAPGSEGGLFRTACDADEGT